METKTIVDNVNNEVADSIRENIIGQPNAKEELEWIILFCERCTREIELGL